MSPFSISIILSLLTGISHGAPLGGRIIGRDAALSASYDFIIVGGGTSGLVVGNRLSENPGQNLLDLIVGQKLTVISDDCPHY